MSEMHGHPTCAYAVLHRSPIWLGDSWVCCSFFVGKLVSLAGNVSTKLCALNEQISLIYTIRTNRLKALIIAALVKMAIFLCLGQMQRSLPMAFIQPKRHSLTFDRPTGKQPELSNRSSLVFTSTMKALYLLELPSPPFLPNPPEDFPDSSTSFPPIPSRVHSLTL